MEQGLYNTLLLSELLLSEWTKETSKYNDLKMSMIVMNRKL
jgi:hypothetical protein